LRRARFARDQSAFIQAMKSMETSFGQTASHSRKLLQVPKR